MTAPILTCIKDWTGHSPPACPWRAFYDPFVQRTLSAHGFFESGQIALFEPDASHRLIEGVAFLERTSAAIYSQQMKLEREEMKRRG